MTKKMDTCDECNRPGLGLTYGGYRGQPEQWKCPREECGHKQNYSGN